MNMIDDQEQAFRSTLRSQAMMSNFAMAGDVVRGILECITNSDDSYTLMEKLEQNSAKSKKSILISVNRTRKQRTISISDRAQGMSNDDMNNKLREQGNRTSGFESGEDVRGSRGMGAKDLAGLGAIDYESIKDNKYSIFSTNENLSLKDFSGRVATDEDRERLGIIRGNGTKITIHVKDQISIPHKRNLFEKLNNHFELRSINSSDNREILIKEDNDDPQKLRYIEPVRKTIIDNNLISIPEYPDAKVHFTLYRNSEKDSNPSKDPSSAAGIVLKGKSAAYEKTIFGLDAKLEANRFSGEIRSEYIDFLVRDYDDRAEREDIKKDNPFNILTPNRKGLDDKHPFKIALEKIIKPILEKYIQDEEKKSQEEKLHLSAKTQKNISSLQQALAQQIEKDFLEYDEEISFRSEGGKNGKTTPDISIIPKSKYVEPNQKFTLSIRIKNDLLEYESQLPDVIVEPENSISILEITPFKPHPTPGFSIAQLKMQSTEYLTDNALIEVKVGNNIAPGEIILSQDYEEPEPINVFCFEHQRVTIKKDQKKRLTLYMPPEIYENCENEPKINFDISNPEVFNITADKEFTLNDDLITYEKNISVEGKQLGAKGTITARFDNLQAKCSLSVGQEESQNSIKIEFLPVKQGVSRAMTQFDEGMTINILCKHPVTMKYLGADLEKEHTPEAQTLLAEIIASEVATTQIEKLSQRVPVEDAAEFTVRYQEILDKYLIITHNFLTNSKN